MREAVKKNANSNESEFFRSDRIFNDAFTRPKVTSFMIVVQFRVNMLANLVINIYRLMDRQMFAFVDKKAMIML